MPPSSKDPKTAGHGTADRSGAEHRPLTPAVFHVLLALADGPLHGYGIMQAAQESAGPGIPMGPSTVYGTLQRLLDAGLVEELDHDQSKRRRSFGLQPPGRAALETESDRLLRWARIVRERRLAAEEGH